MDSVKADLEIKNNSLSSIDSESKEQAVVSIVKANDYDYINVYKSIEKSLELIGGVQKIIRSDDKVFVKINHLSPSIPERGIVTHPIFIQAVLELLKMFSTYITVGDDIDSNGEDGFLISGIRQVCEKLGISLINLRDAGFVETKCTGFKLKNVYVSRIALEADVIVNLPKLKTHSLTVFTGGLKNMYGTIPKGQRIKFHYDFMRIEDFSQMLVDIYSAIKPHLTVMDGIITMEGEGPGSGSPRNLGVVIASQDTIALDAVVTRIIGIDPLSVLTNKYACERGLGVGELEDINIVGEKLDDVSVSNYKLPVAYSRVIVGKVPTFLSKFLLNQVIIRPTVIKRYCIGCFECEKVCPTGAILENDKTATIDKSKCINCMCCHEICRYYAIKPKRTWIGNSISSLANILRR